MRNIPSLKALEQAFPSKGKELRSLLDGTVSPDNYASVREWVAQCYHKPRRQERLECAINEALEGYDIEAIPPNFNPPIPDAVYVNLGDTYTTTLLYDYNRDKWIITSWGDWVGLQEQRGIRYE
jgi:hypothetical protein